MLERFAGEVRAIVVDAERLAAARDGRTVGPEHLLLP
jgi:hypothetical protein